MHILLTNDDGVSAQGINALYKCLSKRHNVYIIAPNEEKSGCSSAITMKEQLKIENISDNIFAVNAFTADCVNIGLKGDIIPKVDLIVSGINHGPNLGDDIYFSGTVAGARVAFIYGISGIAMSLDCTGESSHFNDASKFLMDFIENSKILSSKRSLCLNINYPDIPKKEILGTKYCFMGKRDYRDSYKVLHKDKNETRLQLTTGIASHENDGSDITELKKGYISITPLTLDCTDYEYLKEIIENNYV